MQYLDLRQEEQISLESKDSKEVRKEKLTPSGQLNCRTPRNPWDDGTFIFRYFL